MTTEQIILEIKKRKKTFIVSLIGIFILSYVIQYKYLQYYKSTTGFIVNSTDAIELNVPDQVSLETLNENAVIANRIFRLAYSTEMQNYLIKKFHLYSYYKVDSLSDFAFARLSEKLSKRISLTKTDINFIELTVKDRDRVMPATMANEIASKLNSINEVYVKKQLKRKIAMYEALYVDIQKDLEQSQDKMGVLISNFGVLISSLEKNKVQVENLKYALLDLSNSIKNKRDEMIKTRQFFEIILKTLDKEPLETISVVKRALPDHHSKIPIFLGISFGASVWCFCLMVLMLYAFIKYQKYIRLIFYDDIK